MDGDALVILGNGPSTGAVDLERLSRTGVQTIGMNAAYRHYERANWWPTYYCCFDNTVLECHKMAFNSVLKDTPVRMGFFPRPVGDAENQMVLKLRSPQFSFGDSFDNFRDAGCTGANACQVGVCLGHTKLILVGIDGYKQEVVTGAVRYGETGLEMEETPNENPNYFFCDYQRKGDKFNLPAAEAYHVPAWGALSVYAKKHDIDVVNCSGTDYLARFFRSGEIEKET